MISSGIADYFSFSGGLTRWIIDSNQTDDSPILQYLTFALPFEGRVMYIIGIGDLLITGAVGMSLFRLGYHHVRTYLVLLFAILLTVTSGLIGGGIPALPNIALVTILYVSLQPIPSES
jgi:hypothetical protein